MKTKAEIEADEVRETLERLHERGAFPETPLIKRFDVVPDHDSTGDPAYYIAVLLEDGTPPDDITWEKIRPIEDLIFEKVFKGPDARWPYVRVVREREYLASVDE
jgi:hypothetical protein